MCVSQASPAPSAQDTQSIELSGVYKGTVYLIHLDEKFGHAQHYIGWSMNVRGRLHYHRKGKGSKFLAAVNQEGINYDVVRKWENQDRNFERQLKNRKKARVFCPICSQWHKLKA